MTRSWKAATWSSRCATACWAASWPRTCSARQRRGSVRHPQHALDEKLGAKLETPGVDRSRSARTITCEAVRRLRALLWSRPGPRPHRQHRRGGRRHRRAVDRRAGTAADDAHLPHRWCGSRRRRSTVTVKTTGGEVQQPQDRPARWRHLVAVSRSGELSVLDGRGRERERATNSVWRDDLRQDGAK